MIEIWRDIVGYEGKYQISDLGRIRRISGIGGHQPRDGFLRPRNGRYSIITLSGKPGTKRKAFTVHSLAALAFLGKRPDGYQINHKDGNRLNNAISNLEYVTASQNCQHAILVLGHARAHGEDHYRTKLSDAEMAQIADRYESGESQDDLGAEFGVKQSYISAILSGAKRKYLNIRVAKKYNLSKDGGQSGEKNHQCKLTDSQVREIIARVAKGELRADLAKEFGINIKTISDYVLGVRRKSVTRTT